MITVYTIQHCPFCHRAIQLLKQKKLKYKNIVVDTKDKEKYKKKNKMTTFPQIFYRKKKIGGFDNLNSIIDICEALNNNDIDPLIIKNICKDL